LKTASPAAVASGESELHLPPLPRLIQDAPIEALDFVVIFVFNVLFVGLAALALWPLEMTALAVRLAKAYAVLWGAASFAHTALIMLQSILRINIHDNYDAFVYSNLFVCVLLLPAWSAFAALAVGGHAAGASLWTAALLHVAGFLASFVAWKVVCTFYRGHLYQLVTLPVALATYVLFAAWPPAGRALYGWVFDLF
jgi:hypothetical protein